MSTELEEYSLPVSALQHWAYCPRQCALIHQEQAFAENVHTLRGQAVHRTVDTPGLELRSDRRIERALPIWHDGLGLIGKADVVEFSRDGDAYPVEYKLGSRHKAAWIAACDDLQLAAQAMCLESMTNRDVPEGAIYYAKSKKRRITAISPELRTTVQTMTSAIREMLMNGRLPPPVNDLRCKECSLSDLCQPAVAAELGAATAYGRLRSVLFDPETE